MTKAVGGTELMYDRLMNLIDAHDSTILDSINIVLGNDYNKKIDMKKKNILWLHDLAEDKSNSPLQNKDYMNQFDKFVFVSHWQMQDYILRLGIPWSRCVVIKNAIDINTETIQNKKQKTNKFRFIYTSTPHRGLDVLFRSIEILYKERQDFVVDIFSSYKIYGWDEKEAEAKEWFELISNHPAIEYHGYATNNVVRKQLLQDHVFVYPSTYVETYCLSMVEALSSGCLCLVPNLGALPETSGYFAQLYQWEPNKEKHAYKVANMMNYTIDQYFEPYIQNLLEAQKYWCYIHHNWESRKGEWIGLLENLRKEG